MNAAEMGGESSSLCCTPIAAVTLSSGDQAGIGREARRRDPLLVAAGDVDGEQRRPAAAAGSRKNITHAAVRRKGRALVVEARGQDAARRSRPAS